MDLALDFEHYIKFGQHSSAYTPKPKSHDDGPSSGPFYGGIGAPAFSRSFTGSFNRWHLQPGYHGCRDIPAAVLLVWWKGEGRSPQCRVLSLQDPEVEGVEAMKESHLQVGVLYPFTIEHYSAADMPMDLYLRFFSPIVPENPEAAALPVMYIDVELHNHTASELETGVALFWPNQLGRRQAPDATEQQTDCSWPARSNYGNINLPAEFPSSVFSSGGADGTSFSTTLPSTGPLSSVVLQTRTPERPVERDMEGEVLLCAYSHDNKIDGETEDQEELRRGAAKTVFSRELTFKTEANGTGAAPEAQAYTFPWVVKYFSDHGYLPESEESWTARCHEGIGSAVASRSTVQAQGTVQSHFLLVHDLPIIEFGGERTWRRAYCSQFGGKGRNAVDIASFAIAHRDEWQKTIEGWQQQLFQLVALGKQDMSIAGALINDLYFLVAGGTAWVSGATGETEPVLGGGPHFALLEGFDTGYYYYNTFDLWVYAFPAFLSGWPGLAESVFEDYLRAVDLQDETTRIIYRPAERRALLTAGKIPHDVGSAMEDPWHDLNGYSWRDDPNVWLDHNPAFIAGFYLFCRCNERKIERREWETLVRAAEYMAGQDQDGDGLPEHGEFGDSTWDALSLSGIGAYSGGLALAALAVMATLSEEFDPEKATKYHRLLKTATAAFQRELWNGEYFNNCSRGKYREGLQTDALFGIYLADLAGLQVLPTDRVRSHLLAVYRYNYRGYEDGRVGPLLVSNPSGEGYDRDGGEDLQLDEVIVGSAWAYTAMLDYYGLQQEAGELAGAMVHTLYHDSGLQFRSPAAWDGRRRFRAPLNMRPLASWFLYLNRICGSLPCSKPLFAAE